MVAVVQAKPDRGLVVQGKVLLLVLGTHYLECGQIKSGSVQRLIQRSPWFFHIVYSWYHIYRCSVT